MNYQKRTNSDEFLQEICNLNPFLAHFPILLQDMKEKYEEGAYDVLALYKMAAEIGKEQVFQRFQMANEIMGDQHSLLQGVVEQLGQNPDPQIQGLVAHIEEYLHELSGA